jgi:predicted tellurium resistance membrane protein TerC
MKGRCALRPLHPYFPRDLMGLFKLDAQLFIITAVVSLVATVAIVLMINMVQPGLNVFKGGIALFVYIGVFTANLIIEAARQRSDKNRKMQP